jgi:tetratricopeptide (TPR) repeat protein
MRTVILIAVTGLAVVGPVAAQTTDLDAYYKHVLSVGVEYHTLSPPNEYAGDYNAYEIAGSIRYPMPAFPIIQALLQGGIYQFTSTATANPLDPSFNPSRFDAMHWWGALGVGLHHKFSKSFELGGEISGGMSEAIFRNLSQDGQVLGSPHLLAEAAAVLSFNPAFNLSLAVRPSIRYMYSLTDFNRLNGFTVAVGFSASYRFGEDPDAPQSLVRAVSLENAEIQPVFAAMQSYYAKNPIGKGSIKNTERYPLYDVTVSFFQEGYMDSPTKIASISEIGPGESKAFDITAAYNDRVFTVVGQTPLNATIGVDYTMRNRAVTQSFTATYDLYDRTALTWDDLRKVGAFITPADSALRNYTSFIRQSAKDDVVPSLNPEVQLAMQVYTALTALGTLYQPDPKTPFTFVQGNPLSIDSISVPRDTLKRITGDCDDLTVLYASLLETAGIDTAYITTPGHIYAAFNTKIAPQDYRDIHPDRAMMIILDNELWVPVEITLIGSQSFMAAWRVGAQEYFAHDANPEVRDITVTRTAQQNYKPVVLTETDLGVQYGTTRDAIVRGFTAEVTRLVDLILADYVKAAKDSQDKRRYNTLGIKAAQLGRNLMAEDAFNSALTLDRNYLAPQVNLGNLLFLTQDYQNALRILHRAEELMREQGDDDSLNYGRVLLSIAKCYYELESFDKADEYFNKATQVDPSLGQSAQYLNKSSDGTRASRTVSPTVDFLVDAG